MISLGNMFSDAQDICDIAFVLFLKSKLELYNTSQCWDSYLLQL